MMKENENGNINDYNNIMIQYDNKTKKQTSRKMVVSIFSLSLSFYISFSFFFSLSLPLSFSLSLFPSLSLSLSLCVSLRFSIWLYFSPSIHMFLTQTLTHLDEELFHTKRKIFLCYSVSPLWSHSRQKTQHYLPKMQRKNKYREETKIGRSRWKEMVIRLIE